ncbi:hypothetical protein AB0I68_30950 [Streptomyces sp. NPDC050448]|uniref:hypothetical protein n=1 Tax=Streptomyces sp. NPDC050448 TaxID=3155404 RepID=UPI00342DC089
MRSSFLSSVTVAVAGIAVGVSGPLLLATSSAVGEVAHLTLSAGWSWAALSFLSGTIGRTKAKSAAFGVISLLFAVVSYYLTKAVQGDFLQADLADHTGQTMIMAWGDFLSMTALWCFAGAVLGPLLGIAGHLSRNGAYQLPFRVVVPLIVIVETTMRLGAEASMQKGIVATTWSATRVLAVVAIIALVGWAALGNWRRRSADGASRLAGRR